MHNTIAEPKVMEHMWDVDILRTREHIHAKAMATELPGQVAHIHIHAAGVLTP
jgi:hypothetical protein